jgi:N-carbamoylputrescine amidase
VLKFYFTLLPLAGTQEKKEQYGVNQYGAWMNVMKGHAVQMVFMWSLQTGIGLEKYSHLIQTESNFKVPLYCRTAGEILAQASMIKKRF